MLYNIFMMLFLKSVIISVLFLAIFLANFGVARAAIYPNNILTIKAYQNNAEIADCILSNTNFDLVMIVSSTNGVPAGIPDKWQLQTKETNLDGTTGNSSLVKYDENGTKESETGQTSTLVSSPIIVDTVFKQVSNSGSASSAISFTGRAKIGDVWLDYASLKVCVTPTPLNDFILPILPIEKGGGANQSSGNAITLPSLIDMSQFNAHPALPGATDTPVASISHNQQNPVGSNWWWIILLIILALLLIFFFIYKRRKNKDELPEYK